MLLALMPTWVMDYVSAILTYVVLASAGYSAAILTDPYGAYVLQTTTWWFLWHIQYAVTGTFPNYFDLVFCTICTSIACIILFSIHSRSCVNVQDHKQYSKKLNNSVKTLVRTSILVVVLLLYYAQYAQPISGIQAPTRCDTTTFGMNIGLSVVVLSAHAGTGPFEHVQSLLVRNSAIASAAGIGVVATRRRDLDLAARERFLA